MAMTVIRYGNVELVNCSIVALEQSAAYDRSETDQIGVTTQLTARGYVTRSIDIRDPSRPATYGAADRVRPDSLADALLRPRLPLHVVLADNGRETTVFRVAPARDPKAYEAAPDHALDCDIEGGPKPLSANVTAHFFWGYEVEFRVRFTTLPRDENGAYRPEGPGPWALNNRWSVSEAFDTDFFCTRTYTGVIRLSQAFPAAQTFARFLAFPQLEPGFRRDSAEYSVSENGLEVAYRITDKQEAHAPPWPCTRMEVRHSETLQRFGYLVQSQCSVRLAGPPGVGKSLLLARLAQIFRNRILWDDSIGNSAFVDSLRITDEIGPENAVSGELTVVRYPESEVLNRETKSGWAAGMIGGTLAGIASGGAAGGILGGALGAIMGAEMGTESTAPAGNAEGFLKKLTRDKLGTDIVLDPLPPSPAKQAAEAALGSERLDPLSHIRPHPFGYAGWSEIRSPALIVFFACYYQVPERPPHKFHPWTEETLPDPTIPAQEEDSKNSGYPVPRPAEALPEPRGPSPMTAAHAASIYTFATTQSDFDTDWGREVLIKSFTGEEDGDEEDIAVIQVARPYTVRRMIYEAERIGDWPEIPSPQDYKLDGARARILRFRVQPQPPTLAADGQHTVYRVRAEYEWGFTKVPDSPNLDPGTLPFVNPAAVRPFAFANYVRPRLTLGGGTGGDSQHLSRHDP
ncbi:MAG: hypothetical protein Kow0040_17340 [Thermogutta sp.]